MFKMQEVYNPNVAEEKKDSLNVSPKRSPEKSKLPHYARTYDSRMQNTMEDL